ncbi:hypothetical protein [Dickeya lacustris]|uniref:Effector-associated domain-containing protein n=1 Tax=Dickeya lacustris TaxID=2259638 RepID=A0ABY8G515_9GAMM|nr:hypothetical protein [Dickeya lacustris]WFN55038.1 hypothetical protein O1Q98_15515 [Dickeya lacustris]
MAGSISRVSSNSSVSSNLNTGGGISGNSTVRIIDEQIKMLNTQLQSLFKQSSALQEQIKETPDAETQQKLQQQLNMLAMQIKQVQAQILKLRQMREQAQSESGQLAGASDSLAQQLEAIKPAIEGNASNSTSGVDVFV